MAADKISKIQSYNGLIAPPFTPFKTNGDINFDIIPKYVDHLAQSGVKAIFVNGTTGEGISMTMEERKSVAEAWVDAGKDKFDIIMIQVAANSIRDAQELAAHAEKIGATAIASLPPIFFKPKTEEQLVEYFRRISEAAPNTPFMLYHLPAYSGVELTLSTFLPKARAAIPNFCGAKYTSTEVRDLLGCHRLSGEPFKLLGGHDEVILPMLSCGVTAAVGVTYNFMAHVSLRLIDAFNKGNIAEARKLQNEIHRALGTLAKHGQPMSCMKALMSLVTPVDVGAPRLPLLPLTSEGLSKLKEDLKTFKVDEWSEKGNSHIKSSI